MVTFYWTPGPFFSPIVKLAITFGSIHVSCADSGFGQGFGLSKISRHAAVTDAFRRK